MVQLRYCVRHIPHGRQCGQLVQTTPEGQAVKLLLFLMWQSARSANCTLKHFCCKWLQQGLLRLNASQVQWNGLCVGNLLIDTLIDWCMRTLNVGAMCILIPKGGHEETKCNITHWIQSIINLIKSTKPLHSHTTPRRTNHFFLFLQHKTRLRAAFSNVINDCTVQHHLSP